jgi:hypothetical protein
VRDKSRLADDQCAWYATTRGIVLDDEIGRRVPAIPPESGQGCHNHSVLESDRADLDGLKKLGCSHCKMRVCIKVCILEDFWGLLFSQETSFIQFTEVEECKEKPVGMTNYTQFGEPLACLGQAGTNWA